MIVTYIRTCGGPAMGGMWTERGSVFDVPRERLTIIRGERNGRRYIYYRPAWGRPLWVDRSTREERAAYRARQEVAR